MELTTVLNSVFALIFVLALIGLVSIMLRKYGGTKVTTAKNRKNNRISIEEITVVDSKRRLALIRRDNTEHLVLLSTDGDLLIESGIKKSKNEN